MHNSLRAGLLFAVLGITCVLVPGLQAATLAPELPRGLQWLNAPATSQAEVWGEIERKSAAVAPAKRSSSGYLGEMYEDHAVQRAAA